MTPVSDSGPVWRRLLGFTLLPAIAAISPLVVLPVIARTAGPDGWASALAGEAVGTFAAIIIAYGWTTIGPAMASVSAPSVQGRLYRESIVVRSITAVAVLPITIALCAAVSSPGHTLLAVLMGVQGALIALSYTWFAVGLGRPGSIAAYDAIPRIVLSLAMAVVILGGAPVEFYPAAGIAVTLIGTLVYSISTLRAYPAGWPRLSSIPALFHRGAPAAVNEAGLGLYSAVPVPLVNVLSSGPEAAGFASADKLMRLGQFLPITLANALQSWTGEAHHGGRAARLRRSLVAHSALGILGWAVFAVLGPPVSELLFGNVSTAPWPIFLILGFSFACFSVRTSLIRHFLFPTGAAAAVMRATLIASATGLPLLVGLSLWLGPIGATIGYTWIEATSLALLLGRSAEAYRALRDHPVSVPPADVPHPRMDG